MESNDETRVLFNVVLIKSSDWTSVAAKAPPLLPAVFCANVESVMLICCVILESSKAPPSIMATLDENRVSTNVAEGVVSMVAAPPVLARFPENKHE